MQFQKVFKSNKVVAVAQNDVDLREANERWQQNFTVATRKSCKKTPQISCGHKLYV